MKDASETSLAFPAAGVGCELFCVDPPQIELKSTN